jgi:hypothetical protein
MIILFFWTFIHFSYDDEFMWIIYILILVSINLINTGFSCKMLGHISKCLYTIEGPIWVF